MDIVKYFYEEPVRLEALSAETDPDARRRDVPERGLDASSFGASSLDALLNPTPYFRGYLAGTDLSADRTGLTAITHPEAFVHPLLDVFGGLRWTAVRRGGEIVETARPGDVLRDPATVAVLVGSSASVEPTDLLAVASAERRYAIPELRRLLADAALVAFPEPAHDGWDWSLFAPAPLKERLVAAFRAHPAEGVGRFVLSFQQARSEHKFYFERWTLGDLPDWVEEIR